MALCECGCGEDAGVVKANGKIRLSLIGTPKRFIVGHQINVIRVDFEKQCEYCGEKYSRYRFESGRLEPVEGFRKKKFCSRQCADDFRRANPRKTAFAQVSPQGKLRWIVNADTGCWEWQMAIADTGYGVCGKDGKVVYAHRWSYETFVGLIPEELELDHLCRVRKCVNPYHLEPVRHAVNGRRGAKTRLTPDQVVQAREMISSGHTYERTAAEFDVSQGCIWHLANFLNWKDLDV